MLAKEPTLPMSIDLARGGNNISWEKPGSNTGLSGTSRATSCGESIIGKLPTIEDAPIEVTVA